MIFQNSVVGSYHSIIVFFGWIDYNCLNPNKIHVCEKSNVLKRYTEQNNMSILAQTGAPFPTSPRML